MSEAVPMVEVTRGGMVESIHRGHAVVWDASGGLVRAWGNPGLVMYPRSSCKMIQALPLVESGAADAAGLETRHLALACASHNGAAIHSDLAAQWLAGLGLGEPDLRCGPQEPADIPARDALIRAGETPCQLHNNCSGKHSGFLTLNRHLGGGSEYHETDHVVQKAVRAAFEEVTGVESPGYGIDGCSAPNFATTLEGLARAMAYCAAAREGQGTRETAAARLVQAMSAHPELVAGEGRACTALIRAMQGRGVVKTGAEGVFVAILPERGLGVALKIEDGTTRGAETAIATILAGLGVLDPSNPVAQSYLNTPITSRRGLAAGAIHPTAALTSGW
ncbi:asparaginase [Pseudooceanicola sp. 216_PA32_1]|jgi:L-asparaginase II|uniref:Asparaginase n=1 Tax=Pseudooceanicola pacificus TaxID=2676438 RepID=A0A844W118_9RHOB|nr:asparaginase [Pseudooceanicola pacificus]MWB76795.1 asparaginase [Pseudooceanicola pacificus]